jgi:hypothetical protein
MTHEVYYQDESTLEDAAHLYAVLKEEAATGSPNLENELVLAFLQDLQSGQTLSGEQLGKLLELMKEYGPQIEAFRKSSDESQNLLAVPDGNSARILK